MLYADYLLKLHILCWQDLIEILCIGGALWYVSIFLQRDKQSPLLAYFYAYSGLFIISQILHLPTLTTILLTYAPLCIGVCLLFHTTALQKNFVCYKTFTPQKQVPEWIEAIIRTGLHAFSDNKTFRIAIERTDHLPSFFKTYTALDGSITESFLDLFLQSTAHTATTFLWINSAGKIKGFNGTLIAPPQQNELLQNKQIQKEDWIHAALFITHKTDALIIEFNPHTRTNTVITKATLLENLSIHETHDLLYHYCNPLQKPLSKGDTHAPHQKTTNRTHPHSW